MRSTSIIIWSTLDVGHHWAYKIKAAEYFAAKYKNTEIYITLNPSSSHRDCSQLPNSNCHFLNYDCFLPDFLECFQGKLHELLSLVFILANIRPNLVFFEYPDSIFVGPLIVKYLCPNSFTLCFWMRLQCHLENLSLLSRLKESLKLFVLRYFLKLPKHYHLLSDPSLFSYLMSPMNSYSVKNFYYHPEIISKPVIHDYREKKVRPIILVAGALGTRKRLDLLSKLNSLVHDKFDLVIAGMPESHSIKSDLIRSLSPYANVSYNWEYISEDYFSYLLDNSDVVYSYQPSHLLSSGIVANSIYRNKVIISSENGVIGFFANIYSKTVKINNNGVFPEDISNRLLALMQLTCKSDEELAKIYFSTEFKFSFLEKCFID